jgi:SHS2 domain-containing protein
MAQKFPPPVQNYEVFEHTADIGLRIRGKDLKELFQNAGLAIFQVSSRRQYVKDKKHTDIIIRQKADNLDELFVNWLNELLSVSAAKEIIFHNIKVKTLEDNSLEALITGSSVENYRVNTEIKAATYHQLKIEEVNKEWVAEVILDV